MNAVAAVDMVTAVGFTVALLAVHSILPSPESRFDRSVKILLMIAMGIYVLVGFFNVLEHLGITAAFDTVEDYLEALFFPLLTYVVFALSANGRISDLRHTQEELQRERDLTASVIHACPAAIVMVDSQGAVTFASQYVPVLFGAGGPGQLPPEELWLRPYGRQSGEGPPQTIADIAAQAPFSDQLFAVTREGRELVLSASAERTRADDGDEAEVVLALVDVTERILVDEELAAYRHDLEGQVEKRIQEIRQVNESLTEADDAKRDFLAKLSHELRTPLNSIVGFTSVILRGMAGEITKEQRTQLEMIEASGTRLLTLVNDVLDISKIQTGQAAVSMRPVELHPILACVVAEQKQLAEERGTALVFENESTRPEVRTDANKVEQIVNNLVANAFHFTPEGGIVTVTLSDAPNDAVITVVDTGAGMSPREKDHAFEPENDSGSATSEDHQGAGIGLAIARELCELIGADISVSSAPGEGSRFTVRIPVS